MKLGSRKAFFRGIATAALYLVAVVSVAGLAISAQTPARPAAQAAAKKPPAPPVRVASQRPRVAAPVWTAGTSQRPVMADQIFTNIQVLKGIPATELMHTMGFFSASLLETCTYCHTEESGGSWPRYADDGNPLKNTTRQMIRMTNAINRLNFGGRQVVTCFSCHQGAEQPKVIPQLAGQYAALVTEEPDMIASQNPNSPLPDQIIDKYLQAIGGAERAAGVTSIVAKGTYEGYSVILRGTAELYAKAPGQQTIIFHTASGDSTVAVNGREAWMAGPDDTTPFPVIALSGSELEGLKTDAQLIFPAQIKKTLTQWRTGAPFTINERDVQIVQGSMPSGEPVKLYFDTTSGLLVREVRHIKTMVGLNPYQIDYGNYKDVSGVKVPFHMVITWTDGFSTMDFNDVQVNVPIDPAKFAQPPVPKPMASKSQ